MHALDGSEYGYLQGTLNNRRQQGEMPVGKQEKVIKKQQG